QRVLQGHKVLKLPRVQPIGNQQLIAQFPRRFRRAGTIWLCKIFHDALDSESAIRSIGIRVACGVFDLEQKRERALIEALDEQRTIERAIEPGHASAIFGWNTD